MLKKKINILHVGNIANNAYLNSKFLREIGIKSDVLCYDYYHIMGCPEWEDAKIIGDHGNDFNPDWEKVDLNGFKRPNWFFQNSLEEIAQQRFAIKTDFGSPYGGILLNTFSIIATGISLYQSFLYKNYLKHFYHPNKNKLKVLSWLGKIIGLINGLCIRYLIWAQKQLIPKKIRDLQNRKEYQYYQELIKEFNNYFPKRKDKLKMQDIYPFLYRARIFKDIFKKYDIVQCYATDPIYAMLANKHPNIAFEHGTLRSIPFEKTAVGRLTALAYRKADLVFITNADNIEAAKNLGIKNFTPIPHPFNNHWHLKYKNLKKNKNIIIIFCPMRHDWSIKGIDLYILTLPEIIAKTNKIIKVIFIEWGMDVDKSKNLIKKFHIEENVQWLAPLPRHQFIYWLHKSDIVLDQLILPSMGGITAEAMQAGKPVLASYQHSSNKWMFPNKPPIIYTRNKEDIVRNIKHLLKNPKYANKIGKEGEEWFKKYHSKKIVTEKLIRSYEKLLK